MKPSINLRYKSLLLTCLLIFSAGVAVPAWGQTYTINYKNGSPQTGITERVDTVYVADGEERELFIPELRIMMAFIMRTIGGMYVGISLMKVI